MATITSQQIFRFFQDENITNGLSPASPFLSGRNNTDDGTPIEGGFLLPWTVDPAVSWLTYNCWIESYLDSGVALHKPLPQTDNPIDTLSSQLVSPIDSDAQSNIDGVNLISQGNYQDVVQQMATSTYRFRLVGNATRIGYQIPIPGIKTVAGVDAFPERSGACYNRIVGNFSGIPLWYARWDLWYVVTLPPSQPQEPPPNFAATIRGAQKLPDGIQVPYSTYDYNSLIGTATLVTKTGGP